VNVVEGFFAQLSNKAIRGGAFASVPDVSQKIDAYLAATNTNPTPFIWTKTAEQMGAADACHSMQSPLKTYGPSGPACGEVLSGWMTAGAKAAAWLETTTMRSTRYCGRQVNDRNSLRYEALDLDRAPPGGLGPGPGAGRIVVGL
jgi:hypothetical protein